MRHADFWKNFASLKRTSEFHSFKKLSMRPSKIFFILAIAVVLIGVTLFVFRKNTPSNTPEDSSDEKTSTQPIAVTTQRAGDLQTIVTEERLPAVIVPENATVILAETSGTVTSAPFEVGTSVTLGSTLVRITSPTIPITSKSGVRSEAIRQAEIAASLARKSYKEAKRLAEKDSNKEARFTRDLAKLRLESAEIDLANAIDRSLVRAPLSGIITEKSVDTGSSVTPGVALATIASSGTPKALFQVSLATKNALALGDAISILTQSGEEEAGTISSIGTVADRRTGKFPVEFHLTKSLPLSGTVATAIIRTTRSTDEPTSIVLPLSAVTTGQDGSFFFIVNGDTAQEVPITSLSVSGESAIVSADIPQDASVILESQGRLENGATVQREE